MLAEAGVLFGPGYIFSSTPVTEDTKGDGHLRVSFSNLPVSGSRRDSCGLTDYRTRTSLRICRKPFQYLPGFLSNSCPSLTRRLIDGRLLYVTSAYVISSCSPFLDSKLPRQHSTTFLVMPMTHENAVESRPKLVSTVSLGSILYSQCDRPLPIVGPSACFSQSWLVKRNVMKVGPLHLAACG